MIEIKLIQAPLCLQIGQKRAENRMPFVDFQTFYNRSEYLSHNISLRCALLMNDIIIILMAINFPSSWSSDRNVFKIILIIFLTASGSIDTTIFYCGPVSLWNDEGFLLFSRKSFNWTDILSDPWHSWASQSVQLRSLYNSTFKRNNIFPSSSLIDRERYERVFIRRKRYR